MGMEIKQLLTDGKINFYFGEIDKLSGEEHKESYIKVCCFTMTLIRELFHETLIIETAVQINLRLTNLEQKDNNYLINSIYFFEHLEVFFKEIYNSNVHEVSLSSGNLFINIYSDPVDIQIYFGDNIQEQKKLKIKKTFLGQLLS